MHSHLAIDLLKSFTDEEIKLFGEYIRSEYFNKREVLIRLFNIISAHSPHYNSNAIKKENLYKKLFPGKEYNAQTLRNRMTELSTLIKNFLIQSNFEKDEFARKKYLAKELTKRKKFDLAEKNINDAVEYLEKNTESGSDLFLNMLQIKIEDVSLWILKDQKIKAMRSSYERGEILLNYFFLEFLKTNNDLLCLDIETKEEKDFSFVNLFFEKFDFEGYIKILKERNYEHYPLIASYYYGNLSMMKPEDEYYFYQLKEIIYNYHKKFTPDELYNNWSLLSNCVLVNYLKKGDKFLYEGHEINKFFIENKLYDEKKPFSALGYQNILMNALLVEDLNWGEEFVDSFKDMLPPEVVNNRYHYCKALISFERKKFENSINHLNQVKYTDWDLKLHSRYIYLKNYYEMGLSDQVSSVIDALRHFLSKNTDKLAPYAEEARKNTINYMGKISNAKFGGKKLDYAELKDAEKNDNYLHKKWILQKMKELV